MTSVLFPGNSSQDTPHNNFYELHNELSHFFKLPSYSHFGTVLDTRLICYSVPYVLYCISVVMKLVHKKLFFYFMIG